MADQAFVPGQVGHDAQFDLGVVGSHQLVTLWRDESLADLAALLRTNGDILQVGILAG